MNDLASYLGDGPRNTGRGLRTGDWQGKELRKRLLGRQAGPPWVPGADPTGALGVLTPPWSEGTGLFTSKPHVLWVEGCFWGLPPPALKQRVAAFTPSWPRCAEVDATAGRIRPRRPLLHRGLDPEVSVPPPWDTGISMLEGSKVRYVFQAQ